MGRLSRSDPLGAVLSIQECSGEVLQANEMTTLDPIDLREAEKSVAVANTPIFLARRLRENPALKRALDMHGAGKVFGALEIISARKPNDLKQASEVYFYLVALSLDSDASWLHRARALPSPHIKWFEEIADYLISTTKPTFVASVGRTETPKSLIINPDRPRSPTANTSLLIRL
jgi:hypothetical protein